MDGIDLLLDLRHKILKMYVRLAAIQTIIAELFCISPQPCCSRKYPGRDTAVIGAGTTELAALYQGYGGAQLTRPQRSCYPSWATTNHNDIFHLNPILS
jgi:hypothetical protein